MNRIVEPLMKWYRIHARVLPWREDPTPYHVWLSEIMLQQTRVEAVKDYYWRFVKRLPSVEELAAVDEEELMKLWQGLGYYNRARNLQKAARIICREYGGVFPKTYEEWLDLPGIGEYTAGAVLSIAFGEREPAVDGNVYRIYTRLQADGTEITTAAWKRKVREEIREILPEDSGGFNQALMDLGAMVCLPNGNPLCDTCPISGLCKAHQQGEETKYPVKPVKKKRRIEERTVFLLEYQGKYLIQKRPDRGLLAGLWEFPSQEGHLGLEELYERLLEPGEKENILPDTVQLLGAAKHVFSHVEWHMLGYEVHLRNLPEDMTEYGVFSTIRELQDKYSIPSAFSVYLEHLIKEHNELQE